MKPCRNSIQNFIQFCKKNFFIESLAQCIEDDRKKPRIPCVYIFFGIFIMGVLGIPSLLQLDILLRREKVPFLFPVSDSTIARVLSFIWLGPLRVILKTISLSVIRLGKGKIELPKVGRVKVGIIDGTSFGKILASVISIAGEVDMPIDIEPFETKGKELPASQRLLERFLQTYGRGFVDFIVGDGLYATRNFFSLCVKELGCHGVVKTDEKRLQVIEFAESLFNQYPGGDEYIEYEKGIDSLRKEEYEIWATSYIEWEGLGYQFRVAKVIETHLAGKYKGKTDVYYVITTATELPAIAMRELAKIRWHIENETFKALNEQCHSKHAFIRNEGMIALLLILFASFITIQVYRVLIEEHKEELNLKKWHRISFRLLREDFLKTLGHYEDTS